MRSLLTCSIVLTLIACSKKDSGKSKAAGGAATAGSVASGSATASDSGARADAARAATAAAPAATTGSGSATSDGKDEVARLVVHDVGSKALGSQKISARCVSVTIIPAGDWQVAAARLNHCGNRTARSILWVYKRKHGKWTEGYAGQPPRCWRGIPPDIAAAVTIATKIPGC